MPEERSVRPAGKSYSTNPASPAERRSGQRFRRVNDNSATSSAQPGHRGQTICGRSRSAPPSLAARYDKRPTIAAAMTEEKGESSLIKGGGALARRPFMRETMKQETKHL